MLTNRFSFLKIWVYSDSHRTHTHDIKAIALRGGVLISGGIDTQLAVMKFNRAGEKSQTQEWDYRISVKAPSVKVPPYPSYSIVSFAPKARLYVFLYHFLISQASRQLMLDFLLFFHI